MKSAGMIAARANRESLAATARSLARMRGFARSLLIYHGRPWRARSLRRHYGMFLKPGDLAFDIGAHVGSRSGCFLRLGARVVAVEPQPDFAAWLRRRFGGRISMVEAALGSEPGIGRMHLSTAAPTVATLSPSWIEAVREIESFASVRWERCIEVPVTTLNALIAAYGLPRFCKIDVEGFETQVLRGLSQPIPALSFEYIPVAIGIALEALERLSQLGPYRFNVAKSECHRLLWSEWQDAEMMRRWLASREPQETSGDVYARLGD